ncbi:hypothetical protein ACFUIY_21285 [Streptomyces griseorubiginosus]|uniref:hypothetical protein n=1 Tax=Streptomyces griseorubiginosus TaxID=67304 RepID=UPI00363F6D3C
MTKAYPRHAISRTPPAAEGSRAAGSDEDANKLRDVLLPDSVAAVLATHMTSIPPVEVTLPWLRSDGPPVTKLLYFTTQDGSALRRNDFNTHVWKPALAAAGVIPVRASGERYTEAREYGVHALRPFYAGMDDAAQESRSRPARMANAR